MFDCSFKALTESQAFGESFLEKLSQDREFLKMAAAPSGFVGAFKKALPYFGVTLGTALATSAVKGLFGYLAAKNRYEQHQEALSNSYSSLLGSYKDFSSDPEKFTQRFSELALISPTVASNPRLAQKIIQPKLNKGFDIDDVHRLSSIEFHSSKTPKISPLHFSVSGEHAANEFVDLAKMLGPAIVSTMVSSQEAESAGRRMERAQQKERFIEQMQGDLGKKLEDRDAMRDMIMKFRSGLEKKSSDELLVSEECLARMLADRYSMFKTAGAKGILGNVKEFFKATGRQGAGAMGDYFKVMAIPLAIGGGITLVNQLMKSRETEKTRSEADRVFASLRKSSDYVKERPELASEAFDALRSFAPSLAAKPLIARTFVEHVVKSDGMLPPDSAQMLAKTEQLIQELNDKTKGGFIEGLKTPMSLFRHGVGKGKEEKKD